MEYNKPLMTMQEFSRILRKLKTHVVLLDIEIQKYKFLSPRSFNDTMKLSRLHTLKGECTTQMLEIIRKQRILQNQTNKDLYISKNGTQSGKNWSGIVLWFLQISKNKNRISWKLDKANTNFLNSVPYYITYIKKDNNNLCIYI